MLSALLKSLAGNWKLILALLALVTVISLASYKVGYDKRSVEVADEKIAALAKYTKETAELQSQITALNNRQPEIVIKTVTEYIEKVGETDAEVQAAIDDLRTDNLRLRVTVRNSEASAATASLAATAVGAHATRTAELSREASEFLIREAGRANKVVHKLTALQRHMRDVYKYIDDYNTEVRRFNKEHGYADVPTLNELNLRYVGNELVIEKYMF